MPNYYEFLDLQPTATIAEIETAIDVQYDKWRRLVTHHDPNIVAKANQALHLIEQVRVTLTTPEKRAVYDEAIGITGQIGGLVDPEAATRKTAPSPTPPPPAPVPEISPPADKPERTDAWVCPRCQAPNAVGLRYCSKCGQQIGSECPKCKRVIATIDPFCPYCGIDVKGEIEIQQQQQNQRDRERLQQLQAELWEEMDRLRAIKRDDGSVKREIFELPWRDRFLIAFFVLFTSIVVSLFFLVLVGYFTWLLGFGVLLGAAVFSIASTIWLEGFLRRPKLVRQMQLSKERIAGLEQQIEQLQAVE